MRKKVLLRRVIVCSFVPFDRLKYDNFKNYLNPADADLRLGNGWPVCGKPFNYVVALAPLHLLSIRTFSGIVLMGYEDRRRPAGAAHEVAHGSGPVI